MCTNWTDIVQAIASIIAIPGGIAGFVVLFKKDIDKQKRLDLLEKQFVQQVKLNELQEMRLRMSVKPRIWSNSSGILQDRIKISINNRGHLAFYDGFEIMTGDNVNFQEWNESMLIKADDGIEITGSITNKKLSDVEFTGKLLYHDQENYAYETYLEWKSGKCTILNTVEL
jgi:hypothetical protein